MSDGIANLAKLFSKADKLDYLDGLKAYLRYHDMMARLAEHWGQGNNIAGVTAAFCALSPNNDYRGNLRSLVSMLHAMKECGDANQGTVSTYKHCRTRAAEYLHGRADFLDHAKGLKTRAFYLNVSDPADPEPVTVDGHMILAYDGRNGTMKDAAKGFSPLRYHRIAEAVREIARDRYLIPHQVQAIIWMTRKRIKGVVYDEQLDIFSLAATHGAQQTVFDVREIRPYPQTYKQEAQALEDPTDKRQMELL